MTIKRKVQKETDYDRESRIAKTIAANFSPRSEKTAWLRKRNNLQTYIENNITPVECIIQEKHVILMQHFEKLLTMQTDEDHIIYSKEYIIPIQDEIQRLQMTLIPHFDEIDNQRKEMTSTCIHPYDELRYNIDDKTVRCTFCNVKMLTRG